MKFAAIVTYSTGESTGAVVQANSHSEAWGKLLDAFGSGECLCRAELVQILTPGRITK